jgi:hypothetical protein
MTTALGVCALSWGISLSAYALPKLAEGCHYTTTGTIECEDEITVTGTISECDKHPWNCLPGRPPAPPSTGGNDNTGHGGGGNGVSNNSTLAAIADMGCPALQLAEDRFKGYVTNLENVIRTEESALADVQSVLDSAYYSADTIAQAGTVAKDACDAYDLIKADRMDKETCVARPGKPERCTVPLPSASELNQQRACQDLTIQFQAHRDGRVRRQNDLSLLRNQITDNKRNQAKDRQTLQAIQKQQREKKCDK